MKSQGRTSGRPIRESFGTRANLKGVFCTLFGIVTGVAVIWYTAQFYALFFVQSAMQIDYKTSYMIFAIALTLGTPLFVVFGALSDRIGRKPVMVAGMIAGALTLIPSFHALAHFTNPALSDFSARNPITISANGCTFSLFAKPVSDCDKARSFFARNGLSYTSTEAPAGVGVVTAIGNTQVTGFDETAYKKALKDAGFDPSSGRVNYIGAIATVIWLVAMAAMVYGPMAAFMVEMFPARIRTTSLSLPYHLGIGILGGFLPFVAAALVIYYGNIFAGLWYPVIISAITAVIGLIVLPETRHRPID